MIVAYNQDDSGSGRWDGPLNPDGREMTGRLDMAPYPLITVTQGESTGQTVMVVANGKFGVDDRLAAFDGEVIRLRGNLAERNGQKLFQLIDGAGDVTTVDTVSPNPPQVVYCRQLYHSSQMQMLERASGAQISPEQPLTTQLVLGSESLHSPAGMGIPLPPPSDGAKPDPLKSQYCPSAQSASELQGPGGGVASQ